MEPVRVKICGVTAPEHALAAAEEGADYVGLMFASESRRYLTLEQAQAIAAALRAAFPPPAGPKLVGVFVNEDPAIIRERVEALGLNLVQLSGDEPWEALYGLPCPAFKAYRVPDGVSAATAAPELERARGALEATRSVCLLEAAVAGKHGGTGQQIDWAVAAQLARRMPVLLAGGLTPENVAEAVAQVRPWGVDVSSGVETGGVKDVGKIRAFIRAARGVGELGAVNASDSNTVINTMLHKLITEYGPEKVVLFGSYAYGTPGPDSDIDLLIIKNTSERFIDRMVTVQRVLTDVHRGFAMDAFVLTPQELNRRLAIGDQFIAEIVTRGKILYPVAAAQVTAAAAEFTKLGQSQGAVPMLPEDSSYPADWLHIAERDWEWAGRLLDEHGPELAGFCLQQSVEKFLKAFLLSRGWQLQRTHNLNLLLDEAIKYDADLEGFHPACQKITTFYFIERYPSVNESGVTEEDIRSSQEQVRELVEKLRAEVIR